MVYESAQSSIRIILIISIDLPGKMMTSKKCKKCHSVLTHPKKVCESCGEKPSRTRQIMAWFCIILLLAAGMIWAFTDSEPDVTVVPDSPTEHV